MTSWRTNSYIDWGSWGGVVINNHTSQLLPPQQLRNQVKKKTHTHTSRYKVDEIENIDAR